MRNAYLQPKSEVMAMPETSASQFYSVSAAARMLDVSPSTVWRWIEAEKLPAYRVGPKKIRIRKEDLEAAIRPARARASEVKMDKKGIVFEPPTEEELERRQALVSRMLTKRRERVIAPRTAADLVRKAREQERKSYASS